MTRCLDHYAALRMMRHYHGSRRDAWHLVLRLSHQRGTQYRPPFLI